MAYRIRVLEESMNKSKTLDLTQGNRGRVLLAFILPIMAGSLIQQLYTVVDAVVVGRFAGKAGLAAIDSVYTMFKFPLNFMSGLSAGATIVVSRCFGASDDPQVVLALIESASDLLGEEQITAWTPDFSDELAEKMDRGDAGDAAPPESPEGG